MSNNTDLLNNTDLSNNLVHTDLSNNLVHTDLSNNIVVNVVFDLIKNKVSDKIFTQKLNLDDNSIKVINMILQSNTTILNDLNKHIASVIADKTLDVNDVPTLILMIKDMVNSNVPQINKLKLTREQIITFIKNVLFILIETDTIKVKDKQSVEQLIELSIQLLSTKVNVKKVVKCFGF